MVEREQVGGVGRIENGRSGEKGRMGKGKRKGQYGTGPGPDENVVSKRYRKRKRKASKR